MIRVCNLSGRYYGSEMPETMSDEEILEEVRQFTDQGTPIILVNELDELRDLDIDPADVTMVDRKD